ncbi:MAG TPA: VOC family protein [Blastocatellia bacterium]|nr:VOC family protein [Blastocatellia bacterium]HMV84463.1 VOC family protein [Blastocatellia bacterium]HMX30248.1 VOC family protein [Blastocatellia bacterium]HMY73635.1 VOC family protein [Blastocatellia bacterium]HMZ18880.1 VOC family protein [Blastocatellia bacterium]
MEVSKHAPGRFCWIELGTTDQDAAKKFYSELFGWTINDFPMGPEGVYTMFQLNGRDTGAAYQLMEQQLSQGVPPNWGVYVAVEDADAAANAIKAAGGTIMMEPFDVSDFGRMAVAQDPTGAVFSIWQARSHFGVGVINEPGSMCWTELTTRDVDAAKAFYSTVFGWNAVTKEGPPMPYTEIDLNGEQFGGMMKMQAEWGDMPSNWMVYFAVNDCDGSVQKAESLGGKVCVPPTDIPNTGRFAVLQDQQNAFFSIIKLDFV